MDGRIVQIVERPGTRLHVEILGESENDRRPALVFLHAGVADSRMWLSLITSFSDRYRCILWDRRGYGLTESDPDAPFSHTEDLAAVLNAAGTERAVLVGCSQGGKIALDFVLSEPHRVSGLVLIASAVSGSPPYEDTQAIRRIDREYSAAEESDDTEMINRIEAHVWLDGPLEMEGRVKPPLRDLFLDMNGIALDRPEQTGEHPTSDQWDMVSAIHTPTLVIWGNLDYPEVQRDSMYLAQTIHGAEHVVIPGAAHMAAMEKPQDVGRAVRAFFTRRLPPTSLAQPRAND